ncbi:hypothetical protein Ancab_015448 [Ancistrocladus abbreviatus]
MPPFKAPPLSDFENLSLSNKEKSEAIYPYCNYYDSNADAAHDDIGAVVLNASGDEVICPETSFPNITPRQGKVATTGLLVLGGVPLLTSVLAQPGDASQSRLPSSPQLGSKKPICKALLATKPKPILAHNHGKNKKVSFSSPSVGPFSQSISHSAKKAETRPNYAPKQPIHFLGRPSQALLKRPRLKKHRAKILSPKALVPSSRPSNVSSPTSSQ